MYILHILNEKLVEKQQIFVTNCMKTSPRLLEVEELQLTTVCLYVQAFNQPNAFYPNAKPHKAMK